MKRLNNREFSQRAVELALEFNRYLIEHPEMGEQIPSSARVVLLVEGDAKYNEWAKTLAEHHAKTDERPLVYLSIKKLKPIRSRIEKLELVTV